MQLGNTLVITRIHKLKKCGGVVEGGECSRCSKTNIPIDDTDWHGAFPTLSVVKCLVLLICI